MARATPHITDGILTYRDGMQEHTIAVGSPVWWQWLAAEGTTTFRFEHPLCNFTARRERKRDGWYWYAYRTRGGALQKAYLGKSTDLTLDRLQEAVAILARRSAAPTPAAPTPAAHVTGITSTETAGSLPGALAGGLHDPLVSTKLALPPARPALVPRPRLMDRLEVGLQRKLTLIAAPAGYGRPPW
jgi:LuxR family transcriptional regulator, maltose regulon positive regulatory protein